MTSYFRQKRLIIAIDCIVFGFDRDALKLLLIKRGFEPLKNSWSLMGGIVGAEENIDSAAGRVLKSLTNLDGVYLEQLHAFGESSRDAVERTVSVAYFALIDINRYKKQISGEYNAEWFSIHEIPPLIFDHRTIIEMAHKKLRYKAALHPILFELLPVKFTLPQLQHLYEEVYSITFDERNFRRKVLSTGLLVKQNEKDKINSKKGSFYFKFLKSSTRLKFYSLLNIIPITHSVGW